MPAVVRSLAGAQSYQRGLDHFSHGHVEALKGVDNGVRVIVPGNEENTVTLKADDGVLDYSCDCPVGSDAHSGSTAWRRRSPG